VWGGVEEGGLEVRRSPLPRAKLKPGASVRGRACWRPSRGEGLLFAAVEEGGLEVLGGKKGKVLFLVKMLSSPNDSSAVEEQVRDKGFWSSSRGFVLLSNAAEKAGSEVLGRPKGPPGEV
jgi:hypothetical protein